MNNDYDNDFVKNQGETSESKKKNNEVKKVLITVLIIVCLFAGVFFIVYNFIDNENDNQSKESTTTKLVQNEVDFSTKVTLKQEDGDYREYVFNTSDLTETGNYSFVLGDKIRITLDADVNDGVALTDIYVNDEKVVNEYYNNEYDITMSVLGNYFLYYNTSTDIRGTKIYIYDTAQNKLDVLFELDENDKGMVPFIKDKSTIFSKDGLTIEGSRTGHGGSLYVDGYELGNGEDIFFLDENYSNFSLADDYPTHAIYKYEYADGVLDLNNPTVEVTETLGEYIKIINETLE